MYWIYSCRGPWVKAEHPEQRQADRCGVSTAICVLEDDGHGFHQEKNGAIKKKWVLRQKRWASPSSTVKFVDFCQQKLGVHCENSEQCSSEIPVGGGLL